MAKKFWVAIPLLLLVLIFSGWKVARGRLAAKQIRLAHPQRRTLVKSLSLSGYIDAQEKVTLKFPISGKLAWVGVKEGDRVKKNQIIASLDKRELQRDFRKAMADYLKERNDFEQENADYGYWQHWFELSDEAKRILANDQYDLNKAVADVELSNLALQKANLSTPIAGIVTQVEAPYAGVNITPATAEFKVVNPDSVYFRAEVDEEGVVDLKTGMPAEVTLDAYPNEKFSGKIKSISFNSVGSGSSPSYRLKIALDADNHNLKFRLAMGGEANITVARAENALAIPILALQDASQPFVWVWQSGHRQKKAVKIGLETDEWVEIKQGLTGQEALVMP